MVPATGRPSSPTSAARGSCVTITQGKLVSVDPATGTLLWERP